MYWVTRFNDVYLQRSISFRALYTYDNNVCVYIDCNDDYVCV